MLVVVASGSTHVSVAGEDPSAAPSAGVGVMACPAAPTTAACRAAASLASVEFSSKKLIPRYPYGRYVLTPAGPGAGTCVEAFAALINSVISAAVVVFDAPSYVMP